ncbi:MAG TPA: hypothetical protein VGC77_11285 [Rhodopseudomonas sp.]|uniref:hypothetical protein n=1 Tax=Rhodopseudomonas sp. TaxID=1078 RepID=UPI002EDB0318
MHEFSKWFLRVMIVVGAIGFTALFLYRNLGSLIASSTSTAPTTAAASTAPSLAPVAADVSDRFAPCQPIGRTARGELVFSMDCQRGAAAPADGAATAADPDSK